MKPLLVTLLVLSLAGNFVGAYFVFRRSAPATVAAAAENSALASAAEKAAHAQAAAAAESFVPDARLWTHLNPGNDLTGLVDRLRAAGFPPKIIRAVLQQLVNERITAATSEEKRPYWARDFSPKTREAQAAANRERRDLLESLLGPDGRLSALLSDADRARRYGALSDEKIDALAKMDRDYEEVMNLVLADRMGRAMTAEESRRFAQERELVEREKQADLASLLTPAELEQYEMRSSQTAGQLAMQLRSVEVNEQEYATLYRMQKSFEDKYPQNAVTGPAAWRTRQAAQQELNEQVRSVLSDDRFYDYLSSTDGQFNQTREFAKSYPEITTAGAYEVYRLQQKLQLANVSIMQNQSLTAVERTEQMRTVATDYSARFSSLLGTEAFEAYKKTSMGGMLNMSAANPGAGRP